jgi:hypothetical protein
VKADSPCGLRPAGRACNGPRAGNENLSDRDLGGTLRCLEQAARIPFGVAVAENRVAGDQQLGSRFDDAAHGVVSDAAVHFNPITEAQFPSKFFQAANLIEGVRDELLTAEARIDAHDQDVVNHAKNRDKQIDFCVGVDDDGGLHTVLSNVFEGAMEMPANLVVDADPVRTSIGEGGDEFVGILDHQVAIERELGVLAEGGDDGRADSDVGDEMAIHDVDMDDAAAAALGRGDFVGEAGEIRGKNRWNELDHYGYRVQGAGDRVKRDIGRRVLKTSTDRDAIPSLRWRGIRGACDSWW